MQIALRNEITVLAGCAALALWLSGRRQPAVALGSMAVMARLLPIKKNSFEGKSIVITGGSRGLGLALAEELALQGAWITLLARDEEDLRRAQNHLKAFTQRNILVKACDVTDGFQIQEAFKETARTFGGIDVLINNAGAIMAGPFDTMTEEDFSAQMNVHLFGVLKSIQNVLKIFRRQGTGGRIINISSLGGKFGVPHMAPYCASKFALAGLSQSLAPELSREGIHITTVYPGLMRTGSPIQAVFKGNHEREFAWFAASDCLPGLSVSATKAARQILMAARQGKSEVVISGAAKLGVFVHNHMPELFNLTMSLTNRFMPMGDSKERKTGAASRRWFDRQLWSQSLAERLDRSGRRYNETPKFNAERNLSLQ